MRCFDNCRVEMRRLSLCLVVMSAAIFFATRQSVARQPVAPATAAEGYLTLLENFAGWCESNWNEEDEAFDAQGAGVSWARGNGGVCITYAVLLTEFPNRQQFSPKQIKREVMIDHVRRAIRSVALSNLTCTHPEAKKDHTWGGPDTKGAKGHWQAALLTSHWVVAAYMLRHNIDDDTKALVRQVATSEADLAMKDIPPARPGNTAADDCCWNATLLGVCAAIYEDDPRATKWDDWSKRWALNIEARQPDRQSTQIVDGRPLGEWLVTTQVFPDLTLENHGFWDIPYQVSFAAMAEPISVQLMCGKKVPESYWLHAREEGEEVLKWLVLKDGDLLCPQGLDWAERDVQHQWAFAELGLLARLAWAHAAEARCLRTLLQRQAAFGDGSLHALDFGYQTDLANCWAFSFLLHKYLGQGDIPLDMDFEEPRGAKIFPYVRVGLFRSPNMVSSISWYGPRQAIMIVPNNASALGDHPSMTAYRGDPREGRISGIGYLMLQGDRGLRKCRVDDKPTISTARDSLTVSFSRTIPDVATQRIGYCAISTGEVVVFSKWEALGDIQVKELADHTYYWLDIPGWLPKRTARQTKPRIWNIDDKLLINVFGEATGTAIENGVVGAVRRNFAAKEGDVLQHTVGVYQPVVPGQDPTVVTGSVTEVQIGQRYKVSFDEDARPRVTEMH